MDWHSGCVPIVWHDAPPPYEFSRLPAWIPHTAALVASPTPENPDRKMVIFAYAWMHEGKPQICMATLPFAGLEANHQQYARIDLTDEPMLDTINFGSYMKDNGIDLVFYQPPTDTEPHRYVKEPAEAEPKAEA